MSASAAPLTVNIASDATSTTPAPETQSKQITELTMVRATRLRGLSGMLTDYMVPGRTPVQIQGPGPCLYYTLHTLPCMLRLVLFY